MTSVISLGTHSHFSHLFSEAHLVPVLLREFLVVIGQSNLSSGRWVHLSVLPQVPSWVYCIRPGNPPTQQPCRWPRPQNSGSAGREHWSWPRNLTSEHYYTQLSVMKPMPWKSIFSSRQNKSIEICKESHCDTDQYAAEADTDLFLCSSEAHLLTSENGLLN